MELSKILKTIIERLSRFYFNWILDVKNFYNKSARFYDLVHHFQTLYADNVHRIAVVKAASFEDGSMVLDVGTGTSLAAICAINQAFPVFQVRVIGVDLSVQMLQKARRNKKKFGIQDQILNINCDARHLPLRKDLFNRIISVYGIGGVKTRLKGLFTELVSVGKPNVIFSLGEMTAPPTEKSLLKRKIHELLVEPFINCFWQFRDLNLSSLFKIFKIKVKKRKFYDTNYLGSMTLLVGELNDRNKDSE